MIRFYVLVAALLVSSGAVADEAKPWDEKTMALGALVALPSGLQSQEELEKLRDLGRELFAASFNKSEGAGRPMATQAILPTKTKRPLRNSFARTSGPDAAACGACHNTPFLGGSGDFVTNVFVSEGFNNHDFDTTDPEFSNERGSNHLFGAGLLELLAREMTYDLRSLRKSALKVASETKKEQRISLVSKGIDFGHITADPSGLLDLSEVEGVDSDLVIRPFSQKGVFSSLRQFSVNALNHHHGMQSVERWGARWTGEDDFDEDGYINEVSRADVSALVAWQASLPAPMQEEPLGFDWQLAAKKGEKHFEAIGCGTCHVSALPLKSLSFADPGPIDTAGTLNSSEVEEPAVYDLSKLDWAKRLLKNDKGEYLVPLFGDLKRHKITDEEINVFGNELFSQRFVGRDEFITSELWGVADTAPYGHRNDITTLNEVIEAHGGEAKNARGAYVELDADSKSEIIAYLKTLKIGAAE